MLSGTIDLHGRQWSVREEKRGGPRPQILILTARDSPNSEMHVRPLPGGEARTLEDVQALSADPEIRWFPDDGGVRWDARLVIRTDPPKPDVMLIKFISQQGEVLEVEYRHPKGLGAWSDDEMRGLLGAALETPG